MAATLEVRDLVKAFTAGRPAVDGVSFVVPTGEIVVLLGPSGCGKTTTLRCVAGLEHPTGGAIPIAAVRVGAGGRREVPCASARHGMVFQSYAVWLHRCRRRTCATC
jgi:iron(III) transport system ATP-binding protein